jgi:hypothetical protein
MATRLQERNGERARESEEKFGQHGVAIKLHVKMRRGDFHFKGERERPPLHAFQVSLPKEGGSLKGGRGHHERGELPLGEETQKWGKKPPS